VPTWLQAVILGIVQGLTEFLPVSSTAHLLVGERLLGFDDPGSVFTEMIQLGSIFAIVWLYRAKVLEVVTGLATRPSARRFALLVIIGVGPLLVAGALAADFIESVLHKSLLTMGIAFIVGGVIMLLVDRAATAPREPERAGVPGPHRMTHSVDDISLRQAAGVGLGHVLALIPGVSRSGATIVSGLLAGLDRATAAEYSFFLAMPALAAAFAHSLIELRHQITSDRLEELSIGFVMAFLASLVVVRPFLAIIRRRGFAPFAWYRILAGTLLVIGVAIGWFA
jgi:undecaprenyl-diphosphatase